MSTDSGFLVVKKFETLYDEFCTRPGFDRAIYALPVIGKPADHLKVRYRGLDRNALSCFTKGTLGQIRMEELKRQGRVDTDDDFILDLGDARDVLGWTNEERPGKYEIIWTRIAGASAVPPMGWRTLGYEPTYFGSDHFSAICDCMCFPRWHGTDKEGTLFAELFSRLNSSGLFSDVDTAQAFLDYYLSFDWTETGDYAIAEVWVPEGAY
jgi:hypothetical protein